MLFYGTFDFKADLETLSEKRDGVQDRQAHFSCYVALQQCLVHNICFCGACICEWKANREEMVLNTLVPTKSKC